MTTVVNEPDPRRPNGEPRRGRSKSVTVDQVGNTQIRQPVGYKRRASHLPSLVQIHERRAKAYQLLAGEFTHLRIGLYLHADPSVNTTKTAFPGGYGWRNYQEGQPPLLGEALRQSVSRDIANGLAQAAKYEGYTRDEWVLKSLNSLAAAQAAIWAKVQDGNPRATEVYLQIEARRAKLLGLDRPELVETTTNVNLTVEGTQPDYNPEYAEKMFAALGQIGAISGELAPPAADDDIVDAEVVDTVGV